VTTTFGPRYIWTPARSRISLFGQGVVGQVNGFNSVFPSPSGVNNSTNGLAVLVGGGVNVTMTRHLALRGLDADWLRAELPNGGSNNQNNLRLGAGVVLRFR
jgi:outer membrane immunogenic protein